MNSMWVSGHRNKSSCIMADPGSPMTLVVADPGRSRGL